MRNRNADSTMHHTQLFKQIENIYERGEKEKKKKDLKGKQTEANAHGQVGVICFRFFLP